MSTYYASARYSGGRTVVLAGPFAFHDDAIEACEYARRHLADIISARERFGIAWGTFRYDGPDRHRASFNDQLGYRLDRFGLARSIDGRQRDNRRLAAIDAVRHWRERHAEFVKARSVCGWCGQTVPPEHRNLNPNSTVDSTCLGCSLAA